MDDPAAGITVKYERVVRYKTPSIIFVRFHPGVIQGKQYLLQISNSIVQQLGEQRIVPEPQASTIIAGGLLYSFPVNANEMPQQVSFALEPATVGSVQIRLDIPGRPPFIRSVFALP